VRRLQSTTQEKAGEEKDRAVLINDIANYKKELINKEQEIMDLRRSIEALDANVDEL